uniref:C-type lectin domain-containing protein n=1 Tax=Takifugu rubripes TaxID=31033 RepID=A0A3B5K6S5_TAKRU
YKSMDWQDPNTYVFVNKSMNWRDARTFCRAHHTDLAFVRNSSENGRIAALLPADAWIGLFRVSWKKWSDQERVSFTDWGEGQPDILEKRKQKLVTPSVSTHPQKLNIYVIHL